MDTPLPAPAAVKTRISHRIANMAMMVSFCFSTALGFSLLHQTQQGGIAIDKLPSVLFLATIPFQENLLYDVSYISHAWVDILLMLLFLPTFLLMLLVEYTRPLPLRRKTSKLLFSMTIGGLAGLILLPTLYPLLILAADIGIIGWEIYYTLTKELACNYLFLFILGGQAGFLLCHRNESVRQFLTRVVQMLRTPRKNFTVTLIQHKYIVTIAIIALSLNVFPPPIYPKNELSAILATRQAMKREGLSEHICRLENIRILKTSPPGLQGQWVVGAYNEMSEITGGPAFRKIHIVGPAYCNWHHWGCVADDIESGFRTITKNQPPATEGEVVSIAQSYVHIKAYLDGRIIFLRDNQTLDTWINASPHPSEKFQKAIAKVKAEKPLHQAWFNPKQNAYIVRFYTMNDRWGDINHWKFAIGPDCFEIHREILFQPSRLYR